MASSPKTPILIAGGVLAGAVLAAGALSAGNALADNSTPSPSVSSGSGYAPGGPGRDGRGHGMGLGGLARALHGEFVVPDDDGSGTTTMRAQRGEVTATSGRTVTVKSTDGFTLTWTLNDDTRIRTGFEQGSADGLAVGDQVIAVGPKTDNGSTATMIAEPPAAGTRPDGERGWGRHHWGGPKDGQRDGTTPTPSPSTTTQSSGFDT